MLNQLKNRWISLAVAILLGIPYGIPTPLAFAENELISLGERSVTGVTIPAVPVSSVPSSVPSISREPSSSVESDSPLTRVETVPQEERKVPIVTEDKLVEQALAWARGEARPGETIEVMFAASWNEAREPAWKVVVGINPETREARIFWVDPFGNRGQYPFHEIFFYNPLTKSCNPPPPDGGLCGIPLPTGQPVRPGERQVRAFAARDSLILIGTVGERSIPGEEVAAPPAATISVQVVQTPSQPAVDDLLEASPGPADEIPSRADAEAVPSGTTITATVEETVAEPVVVDSPLGLPPKEFDLSEPESLSTEKVELESLETPSVEVEAPVEAERENVQTGASAAFTVSRVETSQGEKPAEEEKTSEERQVGASVVAEATPVAAPEEPEPIETESSEKTDAAAAVVAVAVKVDVETEPTPIAPSRETAPDEAETDEIVKVAEPETVPKEPVALPEPEVKKEEATEPLSPEPVETKEAAGAEPIPVERSLAATQEPVETPERVIEDTPQVGASFTVEVTPAPTQTEPESETESREETDAAATVAATKTVSAIVGVDTEAKPIAPTVGEIKQEVPRSYYLNPIPLPGAPVVKLDEEDLPKRYRRSSRR